MRSSLGIGALVLCIGSAASAKPAPAPGPDADVKKAFASHVACLSGAVTDPSCKTGPFMEDAFGFAPNASGVRVKGDLERSLDCYIQAISYGEGTGGFVSKNENVRVRMSPDGTAALLTASLTAVPNTIEASEHPLRVTEVFLKDGAGAWRVAAANWADAVPDAEALKGLPQPAAVPASVAKGAEEAAALFAKAFSEPGALAAQVGADPGTVYMGSAPKDMANGASKVKKVLAGFKKFEWHADSNLRAGVAGDMAWVAGNVQATFTVKGKKVPVTYRTLLVYVKGASGWSLFAAHFSNGLAFPLPPGDLPDCPP